MSETAEGAKKASADVQKKLALAKERFRKSADAEEPVRKDSLDDLLFSVAKNQWPADIASRRQQEGKPVITVNRLDQHIKLVGNEQRQQRPSIKINPVGDGASKDTAEILQGMGRHIEVRSEGEVVYDESFDGMLRCGFHYFRVLTEYVDEVSETNFDQEIGLKLIKDAFRVYFDPNCNEPDYSDATYCFIVEDLTPEEYKDRYPDSEMASLADFKSTGDNDREWVNEHNIRVAEYFWVTKDYKTVKSKNGREKKVTNRQVHWAKINAIEILEETEWPGKWIPVIPVLGVDKIIAGKRYLAGLVRNAKGAQRSYNFGISSAWESAGLAPKAPFICDYRTIVDYQAMWEQSNRRNFAALYYNSMPEGASQPLPAPQRNAVEPPLEAFAALIKQADYDLKASLGMFDPSLGQNKSDQSGKAIQSLQKQGDVATLNYSDNLSRSIRHLGRILIDLIPHIYDAPRIQRIVKPDGQIDHVGIFNSKKSQMTKEQVQQLEGFEKVKQIFDIGVGTYDVTVSVGPSYQTKRQEAVATQIELMKNVPAVQAAAPDLIIRNMDIPGADQIADRIKKTLPPQLQDDPGDDPKAQLAQAQTQLLQLSQQHQQLQQVAQEMKQKIDGKVIEGQSREKIADMDNKVKVLIAEINTKSQEAQTRMQMEKEVWVELHGSAHEFAHGEIQRSHEKDMAARATSFEAASQESDQAHQAAMADKAQQNEQNNQTSETLGQ